MADIYDENAYLQTDFTYQAYSQPPPPAIVPATITGTLTVVTTISGGGGGQATGPAITFNSSWSGVNFIASAGSVTLVINNAANARAALGAAKSGINTDITELNGASQVDVSSHYEVAGVQVVAARDTGWSDPTGATSKATFDPATVTLAQLGEFVAALYFALQTHGLIGN